MQLGLVYPLHYGTLFTNSPAFKYEVEDNNGFAFQTSLIMPDPSLLSFVDQQRRGSTNEI